MKVDVPAVAGTRTALPVALPRVSPDGAVPAGIDQVSGAAPPVTANVVAYAMPICPAGGAENVKRRQRGDGDGHRLAGGLSEGVGRQ